MKRFQKFKKKLNGSKFKTNKKASMNRPAGRGVPMKFASRIVGPKQA
jgi:hypothetical protein